MASSDWIEIYGSYSAEELDAEIASLKQQLSAANGMVSQGAGSKSYQRDLLHLQNRLHSAIRVRNNRTSSALGPRDSGAWGVADFSGVRV